MSDIVWNTYSSDLSSSSCLMQKLRHREFEKLIHGCAGGKW